MSSFGFIVKDCIFSFQNFFPNSSAESLRRQVNVVVHDLTKATTYMINPQIQELMLSYIATFIDNDMREDCFCKKIIKTKIIKLT